MSRYFLRILALLIWLLGVLLTLLYLFMILTHKESVIREQLLKHYHQASWHLIHASEALREFKYVSEHPVYLPYSGYSAEAPENQLRFLSLNDNKPCRASLELKQPVLSALSHYLRYWHNHYITSDEINRISLLNISSQCLAQFDFGRIISDKSSNLTSIREHLRQYQANHNPHRLNPAYWIEPGEKAGEGSAQMIMPVYADMQLTGLLSLQQRINLNELGLVGNLAASTFLIDSRNQVLLTTASASQARSLASLPKVRQWFGYSNDLRQIVFKSALDPTPFTIIYSIPTAVLFSQLKLRLINALLLNTCSALGLMWAVWFYERRRLAPALAHAYTLEEHEQFNRKIVASAPVGICILRTKDGSNVLSNELAHHYLTLLNSEDRQQLGEIIRGKQVNQVRLLTGSNTKLQISFSHSRYRNENVAICVLVDVSARIKMEQSLHEAAEAAERANQSKSMFLATVSHELRTPLYGIIGNLDLLQNRELPENLSSLVQGMGNASHLLLKIINDILDFSKIESEQLKITNEAYSPEELIRRLVESYLTLVISKRLMLWCFVEPTVPLSVTGDMLRLQQVLANLLSNAIKFTQTGGIILHLSYLDGYLYFQVRDTGVGIGQQDILQLFDPFYQVSQSFHNTLQGTGLGLAICEKLVGMMEGDIDIQSEAGMGSAFTVRLPAWQAQWPKKDSKFKGRRVQLDFRDKYFQSYLCRLMAHWQIKVIEGTTYRPLEVPLLTDIESHLTKPMAPSLVFSPKHNDRPVEFQPGCWRLSTATSYEIKAKLALFWRLNKEEDRANEYVQPIGRMTNNRVIQVLIVDDHPLNRLLLSQQLGELGFTLLTAGDGLEALSVFANCVVDIVLTDVNMPKMDGYAFTLALRERKFTGPIIGITANALADEKQRCINAGMDDCLSKPITLDQLKVAMQDYVALMDIKKKKS